MRAALAIAAVFAVAACDPGTASSTPSPVPTYAPYTGDGLFPTPTVNGSQHPSPGTSDSAMTTSAIALEHRHKGNQAPDGAIVFGTDYTADAKSVSVTGTRTAFTAGKEIAWRLSLSPAAGGESVRITMTTESDAETQVDSFVAQAGWNVYYGKAMLSVTPGTYVLHYLFNGQEMGSGTFKIKAS